MLLLLAWLDWRGFEVEHVDWHHYIPRDRNTGSETRGIDPRRQSVGRKMVTLRTVMLPEDFNRNSAAWAASIHGPCGCEIGRCENAMDCAVKSFNFSRVPESLRRQEPRGATEQILNNYKEGVWIGEEKKFKEEIKRFCKALLKLT